MNNITKIITKSLCVMLFLLLLTTVQAAATTVSIANTTAELDGTVTLPIVMSDITNYGSGTMDIQYDPSVVHVTGVTGSSGSNVVSKDINNIAGSVRILASNLGGVSGDIVFANVEFMAVGFGSTSLNINVIELCDTSYVDISANVSDGSITVEPVKPFFIYGYVCYENGTQCNNPTVSITNLNTYEEWQAETDGGSNYYQIALTSGSDLNVNDVLRFDATDGTDSNVTDHTITAGEIDDGGLFGFNLTLESIDPAPYLIAYTISNTTITLNDDGIEDDTKIDVKFSEPVNAAIKIENASGVVKSLYTSSSVTNPKSKTWNGTDDGGNIVAGGVYQVNVTMDDGTNPLVYDNTRSITVMVGTITSVSIADATADPGETVVVPLMINDMTDYGSGTINITYNPLVVHVTDVTSSPNSTVTFNINNVTGFTKISASNTDGASGDIVFANVEFTAVGSSGDSTLLNLDVVTLYDRSFNAIPTIVDSGSFTISGDPAPHLVTYTISNTTISPNGDGIMDDTEIDVEFSEPVDAAIRIENATGVIKTLYTGSDVTDPDPQTWDGTDDGGNIVADGTYHVNITMDDGVNPLVYDNTGSIVVANISAAIISIGNASGNMTVPITIENAANVGVVQINITYNASVCMITDVANGTFDYTLANIDNETGWVSIGAWQGNNPGLNGSVILANVTFRINSTNGTSPLNLSVVTFTDATNPPMPLLSIVQNGTYTAMKNGDVNGDGVVNINDAMYLAKHVLWIAGFENINEDAADVDGNSRIDLVDVMYLTKHVLEITGFEELR